MRLICLLLLAVVFSCTPQTQALDTHKEYTFLALGDSYTIGEAVATWVWGILQEMKRRENSFPVNVIL